MARKLKLWSQVVGSHGSKVRVEERVPGGPLYLLVAKPGGGWRKRSLRHTDRDLAIEEARGLVRRRVEGEDALQKLTLARLFSLYLASALPEQSPRHQESTERAAELWAAYLGPATVVETITASHWEAFQRLRATGELDGRGRLVEKADDRRPVGATTIAKELKVLRAACNRALIERTAGGGFLLPVDPTRKLPLPVERNPRRPVCDTDRYEKLLDKAPEVKMRRGFGKKATWEPSPLPLLLRLAGDTGRRVSSIRALRWTDWQPAQGTNGGTLRWRAEHDKLEADWFTPVLDSVAAELAAESERLGLQPGDDRLIFPSPNNASKPVSLPVATDWLRKAESLAGLPHMERGAWHPFRRMFATARKGEAIKDVAALGGWKDTGVLVALYQAADADGQEAALKGGKRIRGIQR